MAQTKDKEVTYMNHFGVILFKFISAVIAFAIGLDLFFNATITEVISFSVLVTFVSYVFGDRIILPQFGKTTAVLADFLLTYFSVWIFGSVLLNNYIQIAWGSIISASILAVVEVFVHSYIVGRTEEKETKFFLNRNLAYSTEFAEEEDLPKKDD